MKVYWGEAALCQFTSGTFASPHQALGYGAESVGRWRRRKNRDRGKDTYMIPQGFSSVHVLPAAVAIAAVKLVPRTKSQKNLGKRQPQMPDQTTSAGERRRGGPEEVSDGRVRDGGWEKRTD